MFTRIFVSALFAGMAAGLIAALLQLVFVQPLLLHAELYETGALEHFGAVTSIPAQQDTGGIDPIRDGLSVGVTMVIYSGFALVMMAIMAQAELRGVRIDARTGLLWGIAGFVAMQLAPGFSLAPEVPGVAAADLAARQIWWASTVIAAAVAMGLFAFGRNWGAWGLASALLLAPHLIGAPEPDTFAGPVPTEIGALFAARSLGVSMVAWVLLGSFCGFFWQRNR